MTSRILIDIGPLKRSPLFRRLWFGYAFRLIGAQMSVTTVIYQVYKVSHSNLAVGLVSVAQVVPGILTPIFGGAIVDAVDRRKVLAFNAVMFAAVTSLLAVNSIGDHPSLVVLFVCSGVIWGLNGLDNPTRAVMLATMLDEESYVAGSVLRQGLSQLSQVIGPAVAGVLIGVFRQNLQWVYWADVGTTVLALYTVFRLPPQPRADSGASFNMHAIAEGFRFLGSQRFIQACFFVDIDATLLGRPTALFPYMALVHFHGGPLSYGLLVASPGIGAMVGAFVSGWTSRVRRQGLGVMVAVVVWGFANAAFGVVPWLWLGVVALAISGWANAVSAVLRSTILQLVTPRRMWGRLTSISTISFQVGQLGSLESGVVAAISNAPISIVTGGLGCILGCAVAAKIYPEFGRTHIVPIAADA